jgi:hypothetical protein
MSTMQTPSQDHAQFDAICADVGEWDTLPAVVSTPTEYAYETEDEEHVAPMDGLILAGLVTPY